MTFEKRNDAPVPGGLVWVSDISEENAKDAEICRIYVGTATDTNFHQVIPYRNTTEYAETGNIINPIWYKYAVPVPLDDREQELIDAIAELRRKKHDQ